MGHRQAYGPPNSKQGADDTYFPILESGRLCEKSTIKLLLARRLDSNRGTLKA